MAADGNEGTWAVEEASLLRDGVGVCVQRPREVMVVPTAWWHATCNVDAYTLGVGGQDSCDLVLCPGFENADHMKKQFCPMGAYASRRCFIEMDASSEFVLNEALEMEIVAEAGNEEWDAWLEAGGEKRRHLDARYTRIR